MRSDREIACDAAVLKRLPESDYEEYGAALIAYAHDKRGFQVSGAVDWNGPLYVQLKQTVVV